MSSPVRVALWLSLFAATATAHAQEPAALSHRDQLYDVTEHGGSLFVVGHPGHLLRSRDGGRTFEVASKAAGEQALFSIAFNKEGLGAAVGRSGLVLVSEDGGESWRASQIKLGEEKPGLYGVDVLDNGTIVAVGSFGAIVRSVDRGKTFAPVKYTTELRRPGEQASADGASADGAAAPPPPTEDDGMCPDPDALGEENMDELGEARLADVLFVSNQRGFVVGEFGLMLETTDGGASFHRVNGCADQFLYNLGQLGPEHLMAVGFKGTGVESTDGGTTWRPVEMGTREDLYSVSAGGGRVLAVGAVGTVVVRDGDGPFTPVETGIYTWLVSSWLNPKGEGLIVGSRSVILRTADGGRTLERVSRGK